MSFKLSKNCITSKRKLTHTPSERKKIHHVDIIVAELTDATCHSLSAMQRKTGIKSFVRIWIFLAEKFLFLAKSFSNTCYTTLLPWHWIDAKILKLKIWFICKRISIHWMPSAGLKCIYSFPI